MKFLRDKNIIKNRINNIIENKFSRKYFFVLVIFILLIILIVLYFYKNSKNKDLSIIYLEIGGKKYEILENELLEIECNKWEKIKLMTNNIISKMSLKNSNLSNKYETYYTYYLKNKFFQFESWGERGKILYDIDILYLDNIEKNYKFILNIK